MVIIDQSRSCFGGGNKMGGIGAAIAKMFGEGLGLKPNEEAQVEAEEIDDSEIAMLEQ